VRQRWQQPFVYASEQVCIGWRRTGACYTDKLTFSHGSSIKVWGAYYTNVGIVASAVPTSVGTEAVDTGVVVGRSVPTDEG